MAEVPVFCLIALAVLFPSAAFVYQDSNPDSRHEMKVAYCKLLKGQRIFKTAGLQLDCVSKVGFFEFGVIFYVMSNFQNQNM